MKRGIDISHHNPNFDFTNVKNIEFIMVRAGFGKNNLDREYLRNVSECERLGIPFGCYWFSYALTPEMAEKEADYLCDSVLGFNPSYPLAFDFEYGSIEYMKKQGVNPTHELIRSIAEAFLNRIEERGYYAMLYTNRDFLSRYFNGFGERYALWYAEWNVENPSIVCPMWQYGIDHEYNVDGNYCYKDYPSTIEKLGFITESQKTRIIHEISTRRWNDYYHAAKAVMAETSSYSRILEKCREMNLDFAILEIIILILKGE